MKDKVWVIDGLDDDISPRKTKRLPTKTPPRHQRNPALAFSLSILVWGVGQFYNRQRKLGLFFLLLMEMFYAGIVVTLWRWESLAPSLSRADIPTSYTISALMLFFLSGVGIWFFNAYHAYQGAARKRTAEFEGVGNPLLPPLCSLFIPGWGQFLNGQRKKGRFFLFFLMAGFFALFTFLFFSLFWPTLDTPSARILIEILLVISVAFSPFVLLMWLISVFDSFIVCMDPTKKEPLRNRIEYAMNRFRMQGLIRGLVPQIKLTLLLSLFLILSLTFGYSYFPKGHIVSFLHGLQSSLSHREMVLVPELVNRFLQVASLEKSTMHQETSAQ